MESVERIVRERCGDVADRIRACRSCEVALHLRRVVLMELGPLAESSEVRTYVERIFAEVIKELWDGQFETTKTGERDG